MRNHFTVTKNNSTHSLKPKNIYGEGFKRLTVTFLAWTVFLLFAGTIIRATDFSQSIAWIEYRIISSITVLVVASLTVLAWRSYKSNQLIYWPVLAAVITSSIQIFSGIVGIQSGGHPLTVGIYLLAAMLNLSIALFLTTVLYTPPEHIQKIGVLSKSHRFYFRSIVLTSFGFVLLLITGLFVTGTGTGLACADWPLCRGEIFPAAFTLDIAISLLHRFTVVAVGVLVAAVILQTRRGYKEYGRLVTWSTILGVLFIAQIGIGGLYVLTDIPASIVNTLHLGLTIAVWVSLVVLAAICYLTVETVMPVNDAEAETQNAPAPLLMRQKAKTFFKLTKPWILVLLLLTTVTAMVIATEGLPPISLILYTLLGGALSAAGASVLNSYIDSDIDQLMSRTSRRATATGLVTPQETLIFGLTLSVLSFLIFAIFVNLLSAILSTIGIIYYVFFYTLYLKRATIHNIIIGGAAGAIPPLVGWTAVTNSLELGAFYLFAIIFFWTPPHTWALALLVKKDYARARVPMLPVVVGEKETTYQIFLYTILLITLTLLPFTFDMLSWVYLIAAIALGIPFIYLAWKLWRNFDKSVSKRLYKFSQAYLALLFLVMALDRSLL